MDSLQLKERLEELARDTKQLRGDGWNAFIDEALEDIERRIRVLIVELEMSL